MPLIYLVCILPHLCSIPGSHNYYYNRIMMSILGFFLWNSYSDDSYLSKKRPLILLAVLGWMDCLQGTQGSGICWVCQVGWKIRFQSFPNLLEDKNRPEYLLKTKSPGDSGLVGLGGAWESIFQNLPSYHSATQPMKVIVINESTWAVLHWVTSGLYCMTGFKYLFPFCGRDW